MIVTPLFRTMNAIRMVQQQSSSMWAIFGQTSAWTNENQPPDPSPSATSVNQAFCTALATLYWVYPDPNNAAAPFAFKDAQGNTQRFSSYATAAAAIAGGCTLVLATCQITGAQIIGAGSNQFRQIGFASNVVATTGNGGLMFLNSGQVQSWGNLESLQNRVVTALSSESNYIANGVFAF